MYKLAAGSKSYESRANEVRGGESSCAGLILVRSLQIARLHAPPAATVQDMHHNPADIFTSSHSPCALSTLCKMIDVTTMLVEMGLKKRRLSLNSCASL
jgi:hypothetical protein